MVLFISFGVQEQYFHGIIPAHHPFGIHELKKEEEYPSKYGLFLAEGFLEFWIRDQREDVSSPEHSISCY
jgi:hypothetical protein